MSEQSKKQIYPKEKVVNESKPANMAAAADLLQELKSMRAELKGHITKLSDELKDFQRNTNERLSKIESIMSKVDEIDGIKSKQQSSIGNGGSDAVLQTAPEKAATPYTTMIFSSSAAQEITK